MQKIDSLLGVALFFMMLIYPGCYAIVKIPIIFYFIIRFALLFKLAPSINYSFASLLILSLVIFTNIFWSFIGLLNQNDFLISKVPLYVLWPMLYSVFLYFILDVNKLRKLIVIILYSHCFLTVYFLYFMLSKFWGLPFINIYPSELIFSIYETLTDLPVPYLNILVFSTPMLVILLFTKADVGINRLFLYVIFILTIVVLILSGRRMYMLTTALSLIFPLLNKSLFDPSVYKSINKAIVYMCGVFVTIFLFILYIDLPLMGYVERFQSAFSSNDEPVKFLQLNLLIDKFLEKPLLGHGIGVAVFEPSRQRIGGSFELSYIWDLVNYGIIGCMFLYSAYILLFIFLFKICRTTRDIYVISLTVGLISFMIGQATNPFFSSYDYLWPLYICVAAVNIYSKRITREIFLVESRINLE